MRSEERGVQERSGARKLRKQGSRGAEEQQPSTVNQQPITHHPSLLTPHPSPLTPHPSS
ncbi:hypothetical protein [Chroococcidiopsis sp. SAG 2025]|uniref:hypothetical protein n=1 Tax=Chroococcidiopsis sp. SAG 2025 TaxID=171389 RepID=UPI002936F435|nr:hypothetical protein [Chroococcidiopsis sp. SAG 2025]